MSRSDGGYKQSQTSESLKEEINNIAKDNKLLQVFYFDILINPNKEKLGDLKDELDNINIVYKYFHQQFFKFLSEKMNIEEELSNNLIQYPDTDYYLKQLCQKIENFGISNYKEILDEYNSNLEKQKEEGKLMTPQQVVNFVNENNKQMNNESQENELEIY